MINSVFPKTNILNTSSIWYGTPSSAELLKKKKQNKGKKEALPNNLSRSGQFGPQVAFFSDNNYWLIKFSDNNYWLRGGGGGEVRNFKSTFDIFFYTL